MQGLLLTQNQMLWAIPLVLGLPLLTIVLGEIIESLERRRQPLANPLKSFRNLVLPFLFLFLILTRLAGLDSGHIGVRIIQTGLWIAAIYTALSLLNTILFVNVRAGAWQTRVPKLLVDLSRSVLVLIGTAIILANVWGTNLGAFVAALGFGSFALAFALQNVIGNIFSGLLLMVEQPFSLDEWIEVGGIKGRVAQINWRSVHLETPANDLVIVPNSEIANASFKNFSRPKPAYEQEISISFSYDNPPRQVIQLLRQTALEAPFVIPDSVWVSLADYGDFAISYLVGLSAATMSESIRMRNEFRMRLWYMAKRHGLTMPYPIATQIEYTGTVVTPEDQANQVKALLGTIPSLARLEEGSLDRLVRTGQVLDYCGGETIINLGSPLSGLYFIIAGNVELSTPGPAANGHGPGGDLVLGQLSQGEFFAEQACLPTQQLSSVKVLALTDVQVFVIKRQYLQELLDQSPRLAQQIAEVMELRKRNADHLRVSRVA